MRWPFILGRNVGTIVTFGSGCCSCHGMRGSMIFDHQNLVLRGLTAQQAPLVSFTAAGGSCCSRCQDSRRQVAGKTIWEILPVMSMSPSPASL